MKLTPLFLLTALSITQTSEIYSQKYRLTLNESNTTIASVIEKIEIATGYNFIYNVKSLEMNKIISINVKNQKIETVLKSILENTDTDFKIKNNYIILKPKEKPIPSKLSTELDEIKISGKVTDEYSVPIASANIKIKGSTISAQTDSEGNFYINAELGNTLVISFVGHSTQEVIVGSETNYSIKLSSSSVNLKGLTVIGSRGKPRTDVNRHVPIDVISAKELQNTGQVDLGQMAQFTSPSFNSAKNAINGVANFADPASLRGMSPDQSLITINRKRRHQFSAINNNITAGKGTVITDLNSIPVMAIEHLEILRDGAAAQYGSDAIAGIINLSLKKNYNSGTFRTQFGATSKGDGITTITAFNYGVGLGKPTSYLNFTLHYQYVGGTDRTDPYNGTIYNNDKTIDDATRDQRGVWPTNETVYVTKYGSNQAKVYQVFINLGYPLGGDWNLYSFGGISKKDILAYGFFRNAKPTDSNSNVSIFPDGYTPELPGKTGDYSLFAGVTRKTEKGWGIDVSTGYGLNYLDLFANNTANPSMGADSPTDFYVGRNTFGQSTTEANFSKNYDQFLGTKYLNLAFGSQFRVDNYKLSEGDAASYTSGPLALLNNKSPGSSGRPGISPEDEVDISRTNFGLYVDIESDISEKFLVALAGRYENYSDFGNNFSGKLASRLNFTKNLAVRGSINRGFRAPSLQQIYNNQTTSTVQAGVIRQTKQLRSDDPRLLELGIEAPKAELSWNYNVGLTAKFGRDLIFTVDAYQIDVTDRIILSDPLIASSSIPRLLEVFPPSSGIKEITFFTNLINTRTRGIDFVTSYKHNLSSKQFLNASLAFTLNKTEVTSQKDTPAQLQEGATSPVVLIDVIGISLIETSQPRQKILASVAYQLNKWNVSVRATYFGEVTALEKPPDLSYRSQVFGGKTLTDMTINYDISKKTAITLGVNNLFDVYPDKVIETYASYFNGQIPYTRNANQFGFNGSFYYTTLNYKF